MNQSKIYLQLTFLQSYGTLSKYKISNFIELNTINLSQYPNVKEILAFLLIILTNLEV